MAVVGTPVDRGSKCLSISTSRDVLRLEVPGISRGKDFLDIVTDLHDLHERIPGHLNWVVDLSAVADIPLFFLGFLGYLKGKIRDEGCDMKVVGIRSGLLASAFAEGSVPASG